MYPPLSAPVRACSDALWAPESPVLGVELITRGWRAIPEQLLQLTTRMVQQGLSLAYAGLSQKTPFKHQWHERLHDHMYTCSTTYSCRFDGPNVDCPPRSQNKIRLSARFAICTCLCDNYLSRQQGGTRSRLAASTICQEHAKLAPLPHQRWWGSKEASRTD